MSTCPECGQVSRHHPNCPCAGDEPDWLVELHNRISELEKENAVLRASIERHGKANDLLVIERDALRADKERLIGSASLLLTNWPRRRDGMDNEILPIGVKQMRYALDAARRETK